MTQPAAKAFLGSASARPAWYTWLAFGVYSALLVWVVMLKFHTSFTDLGGRRSLNLVPFGASGDLSGLGSREIALNVLAFIPFGLLVYFITGRRQPWQPAVVVVLTSVAFETIQYATGRGASDITDVITNVAGGLIGIGIAAGATRMLAQRAERAAVIALTGTLALLAIAIAVWLKVSGVHFRL